MPKRVLCFFVTVLLVLASTEISAQAQAKEEARGARSAKIKEAFAKLGLGEGTRVDVALADKSFRSGYLCEADDDSFVMKNPELETQARVAYDEVKELKAENPAKRLKLSVPAGKPRIARAAMRFATLGKAGGRPRVEASRENFSKAAAVVLVVLAVGLILVGVELGKS